MAWSCDECKRPINLVVVPVNDQDRSYDIGMPLYRKQEFVNGKVNVICGYCSPECSKVAYEKIRIGKRRGTKI